MRLTTAKSGLAIGCENVIDLAVAVESVMISTPVGRFVTVGLK